MFDGMEADADKEVDLPLLFSRGVAIKTTKIIMSKI
jgi:hypothetical protein